MSKMPGRIRAYVWVVTLVAVATAYFLVDAYPFDVKALAGFAILSFVAAQFPLTLPTGALYDVSFVITIAAIISAGPAAAAVAAVFGTVSIKDLKGRHPLRHLFNAAELSLSAGAAGAVYAFARGPQGDELLQHLPNAVLGLALATAVNFTVNTSLVSGAISLSERKPFMQAWRSGYQGIAMNYVAFALLGLLLGVLYVRLDNSWAPVLFLLMPLLVARQAFQAAITMQSAYDDTVRGIIKAIEAKDPYTRGHAERVSRLAEMTARAYGLSEERCRAIRYAALMHDVGKLTVQSKVLQKPGKLTDEEYEHMKIHPLRGVEIIKEIDLLEEAIVGVRHHHERIDGKGYPDGLAGEAIPLFARLITVSDAFDSMTSTRTYRRAMTLEAAFAELDKWSGQMFDPDAIAALKKAVARNGWQPTPELVPEVNDDPHKAAL